jgi:iron complex outermembrane receptor protein
MLHAVTAILTLCHSGADSLPAIDTVRVRVNRREIAAAEGYHYNVKLAPSARSLSEALSASGLNLKQYGPAGLAVLSMRGAEPQQTAILWNGIPIANPMLGMVDLNTMGIAGVDEVSVITGAASAMFGSGNVGGALYLNNQPPDSSRNSLEISGSNWKNMGLNADVARTNERLFFRATAQFTAGENAYGFFIPEQKNLGMQKDQKAQFQQGMLRLMSGYHYKAFRLKAIAEHNISSRFLGTQLHSGQSYGDQKDENSRVLIEGKWGLPRIQYAARWAYTRDAIDFNDPLSRVHAVSNANAQHAQIEAQGAIAIVKWFVAADVQYIKAFAPAYSLQRQRSYPAQMLSFSVPFGKWNFSSSNRFEWFERIPVFSGQISRLVGAFKLGLAARSSFRRPTMNDLFWGAANGQLATNLNPEKGEELEFNQEFNYQRGNSTLHWQHAFYARKLNSPILWMPSGAVWLPVNYNSSQVRGMQGNMTVKVHLKQALYWVSAYGEWNDSRLQSVEGGPVFQRLFIPSANGQLQVGAMFGSHEMVLSMQFSGKRYVTQDNSDYLNGYALLNANWSRHFKLSKMRASYGLALLNITQTAYYIIPGRPMPAMTMQAFFKSEF